jgi:putative flippase GtrA
VKTLLRWYKFNIVGAMGMVVQLIALGIFDRLWPGHYLLASAVAVELALLHNFVWHFNYTWRDRRDHSDWFSQLLRFHFSNGLISMIGNLALMNFLVHQAHLPVLASNVVAILCCSLLNFGLGELWAFRGGAEVVRS